MGTGRGRERAGHGVGCRVAPGGGGYERTVLGFPSAQRYGRDGDGVDGGGRAAGSQSKHEGGSLSHHRAASVVTPGVEESLAN